LKAAQSDVDVYLSVHSSHLNQQLLDDLAPKVWLGTRTSPLSPVLQAWIFETDSSALQGKQVRARLGSWFSQERAAAMYSQGGKWTRADPELRAALRPDRCAALRPCPKATGQQCSFALASPTAPLQITRWSIDPKRLNVPFRSINDIPNYCTCLVADSVRIESRETDGPWPSALDNAFGQSDHGLPAKHERQSSRPMQQKTPNVPRPGR
jgi:hypothetical protein